MSRLGMAVAVLNVALALWHPSTSQDSDEGRIASLETRGAVLAKTERANRPTPVSSNDPAEAVAGEIASSLDDRQATDWTVDRRIGP